jgi:hypothetical protein
MTANLCIRRRAARALGLAAGTLLLSMASPAFAAEAGQSEPRVWLSVAALTGSTQPDAKLADYQWRTTPSAGWGAQAMAGRGRAAAGLRLWSSETRQSIDVTGASVNSASVNELTYEAVVAARAWTMAGFAFEPSLSGGRLHFGYQPDQVAIPTGGASGATMVKLGPIDEWTWGGGLAMSRPFGSSWNAGLGVDRRFYSLDTAHRNGSVIQTGREAFGDWSVRVSIARRFRIG